MNSMPAEQAQSGNPGETSDETALILALEERILKQDAEIARLRSALAQSESCAARLHGRIVALGLDVEPQPEPESQSLAQLTQISVQEQSIPHACFGNGSDSTPRSELSQQRQLAVIDVTVIDAM